MTGPRGNAFVEAATTYGALRGIRFRGIESFLGIPYGAPTSGRARFTPPARPEPWSGAREALHFGDAPPQVDTRLGSEGSAQAVHNLMYVKGGHPLDGARMSEDCLNLNVWTPASDDGGRRPVMVWFHGGGFVHGSAGSGLYNGDELAALGDVVVVTVNARLGLTGFLPLDQLVGPDFASASNAGVLDLVAALEWVRDNIAGFGGDPGNVTIFGQSGGGGKVNVLMAMPSARGLFHKAINMSGPMLTVTEPAEARQLALKALAAAGVDANNPEAMRELPLRALLDVQRKLSPALGAAFGMNPAAPAMSTGWGPVLDGTVVVRHPFGKDAPAMVDKIPMMIGYASHDPSLLMAGSASFPTLGAEQARSLAAANFGDAGVAMMETFNGDFADEPVRLRYARVVNAFTFKAAATAMVEAKSEQSAPVYLYEFAHTTDILDGLLGTTHSLDLPFVFNNVDRSVYAGELPSRHHTSRNMALAWASFALSGNPNHDGIPLWAPDDGLGRGMRIGPVWQAWSEELVS
ncbi:carboxylesterase/lipase family protein [Arthrobacter sp. SDTb3-6]|uniref:carboxylesterase/lipase family protein n=1 Tax=Arthrobacter sp. SDTb3-6 TaxID=2713571 RepID=UPI00159E231C|nr:carboxylesterase family protein [Arthrobacter sp. SDTb3-6]NVN00198.1 carboxylesterase family protein [Arthrobacter sp. SDTb3-6]